ncbi:MAG: hypothetical protein ACJAT0_000783 [Nonlabens sp.]|jgi:hypothetical protein
MRCFNGSMGNAMSIYFNLFMSSRFIQNTNDQERIEISGSSLIYPVTPLFYVYRKPSFFSTLMFSDHSEWQKYLRRLLH